MKRKRRIKKVAGMGRVGGIYFVGSGWTQERIERALRDPIRHYKEQG